MYYFCAVFSASFCGARMYELYSRYRERSAASQGDVIVRVWGWAVGKTCNGAKVRCCSHTRHPLLRPSSPKETK